MTALEKPILLPADFVDNRIIVRPKTKSGIIINFLTDTGGGLVITPEGVKKANLHVYKENIDDEEKVVVMWPEMLDEQWIPPLLGEKGQGKLNLLDTSNGEGRFVQRLFQDDVNGLLGQAWFANRIWTFDYLQKRMLYHGALDLMKLNKHGYVELGFQKNQQGVRTNSFPRIRATIDGEVIDFLFDTGATLQLTEEGFNEINDHGSRIRGTSFISENVFNKWKSRHPEWRIIENAEQDTGFPIIEVPEISVAGYLVGPVWFTYRHNASFHQFMSQWMDKKVEGALGGSALQYFKITIDYSQGLALFEQ